MEIIGRIDVPNLKAEGERRSDADDIESFDVTMRGLHRAYPPEGGQVPTPTVEVVAEAETTPLDNPIWDEVLQWCP